MRPQISRESCRSRIASDHRRAGGAAHLAGVIAAHTWLPFSVFQFSQNFKDSTLSYPLLKCRVYSVGTLAIGEAGAKNAALLAAAILALSDEKIRRTSKRFAGSKATACLL